MTNFSIRAVVFLGVCVLAASAYGNLYGSSGYYAIGGTTLGGFFRGEPLEEFKEFGGFNGNAGGKVAGLVIFVPLALLKEHAHEVAEPLEGDAVVAQNDLFTGLFAMATGGG